MSPFILSVFNSIGFVLYCYLGSYIILNKRKTSIKTKILALLSVFAMYYLVLCLLDSVYSMFFSGLCAFFLVKLMFKESIFMSLFISIILNTFKIGIKIIFLEILNNDNYLLLNTYKTLDLPASYINFAAMGTSFLLMFIFRKQLSKFIKYISGLNKRKIVLLTAAYINFLLIYLYQPPFDVLSLNALADIIIIIGVTGVGILSISSEMKMESLTNHYKEIYEYSKANEELINNYKMEVHENKNRLIVIDGMLNDSNKDVKNYIECLLKEMNENKANMNYWLTELQNIPLTGIRNFINYKLIKLKELDAKIEVFVSSKLRKLDPTVLSDKEYNQLTTILGVVLDNMIESIKETSEKLVSISIYLDDGEINAEFVNAFSNNIDLNRLNEVGYTTKGEKHGVGLPLVAKIIKSNSRFGCVPNIVDNFFSQNLTIKIWDKKNLQKIKKN